MKKSLVFVAIVAMALVGNAQDQDFIPSSPRSPVRPFESDADPTPRGRIDELVFGRLKQLGIAPAKVCSDAVFLRRAYLDVIGTLPTADEARQFLKDPDVGKRGKLVDRLLEREEFVDYWTMKWCDLLRVKSEFPINLWPNAVQAYHRWIRTCVQENVPYDRFVREMLTASGSNFRKPQVNFYRALQSREPQAIAQAVALSFMGVRPQSWPKERWSGMAAFFSEIAYKPTIEWKEEIVLWDLDRAATESAARTRALASFPDQTAARLPAHQDPRQVFANWLITPQNPWFTRHIANRVWFWLLGRGIIHPADDLRPDNSPSNPELLAFLEQELVAARYDLKRLYRLILNSTTYQLSHVAATERVSTKRGQTPEERGSDPFLSARGEANFAFYPLRRLEAEVLIDALCQMTGTRENYSSIIPEPYTFMPDDQRAVSLADASITSPFLEKFGRSSRDTGLESDRNNRPTAAQRLHLLNSSHVRRKFESSPRFKALTSTGGKTQKEIERREQEAVRELYLTILSRFPTEEELKILETYAKNGWRWTMLRDLAWALVNGPEFSYRH